jgi:anti-anti-sigma regulatory factor
MPIEPGQLVVHQQRLGETTQLLRLAGDCCRWQLEELAGKVADSVSAGDRFLIFDLGAVVVLDSAATELLHWAAAAANERRGRIAIVTSSTAIAANLDAAGLSDRTTATLEQALDTLAPLQGPEEAQRARSTAATRTDERRHADRRFGTERRQHSARVSHDRRIRARRSGDDRRDSA